MAAHSNRSPSPISSRPNTPNPRNSENQSTKRRSFSGNYPSAKPSALTNPRRFDPIIPANSPSDFSRRPSSGKEGSGSCLKNCEEKENNEEKDQILLKTSKLQSPAKGSKNFMAPTISAASKFTPSPRKKVLAERNDPVRTSISLSDGRAVFFSNVSEDFEPKTEMGSPQNQKSLNSLDFNFYVEEGHRVSKPSSKKVAFIDETFSSDGLKMESNSKNSLSCSPNLVPIAPLDADPFMPPYDPKTNYLSPRPQFLYYKPNPRLNKEKVMDTNEFEPLEDDSFTKEIISDSFSSDSECTEDSEKEKSDMVIGLEFFEDDDLHVSKDTEREKLEPIASADMVMGQDEMEDGDDIIHVQKCEEKSSSSSWGLSKLMCFSMVMMMLLMACASLYVARSRSFDAFGIAKDLSFSDLRNSYHQSRVSFDTLVRRMKNQFSVVSRATYYEHGKRETTMLGSLNYANLSDLHKDYWNDRFIINEDPVENSEDDEDDSELDENNGLETEMECFEEGKEEAHAENDDGGDSDSSSENDEAGTKEDGVLEIEEKMPIDLDFGYSEDTQERQGENVIVTSISISNMVETEKSGVLEIEEKMPIDSDFGYSEDTQGKQGENVIVPSISISDMVETDKLGVLEIEEKMQIDSDFGCSEDTREKQGENIIVPSISISDMEETEKSGGETSFGFYDTTALLDENSRADVTSLSEGVASSEMLESPRPPSPSEDLFHAQYNNYCYAIGISSMFAALFGTAAFIFLPCRRNGNHPSLANVVQTNKKPLLSQDKALFSQKWRQEEDDDDVSSCPSEMSSFQKSGASYHNKKKEMSGREMGKYYTKRESLASSSSEFTTTGSPSYGSFTTFEKIPIKNANGEEEIITPVRRSSRIRKHQSASPLLPDRLID
ncbi:hypothetical protein OROGR_009752 [Orobanche gracilis]